MLLCHVTKNPWSSLSRSLSRVSYSFRAVQVPVRSCYKSSIFRNENTCDLLWIMYRLFLIDGDEEFKSTGLGGEIWTAELPCGKIRSRNSSNLFPAAPCCSALGFGHHSLLLLPWLKSVPNFAHSLSRDFFVLLGLIITHRKVYCECHWLRPRRVLWHATRPRKMLCYLHTNSFSFLCWPRRNMK